MAVGSKLDTAIYRAEATIAKTAVSSTKAGIGIASMRGNAPRRWRRKRNEMADLHFELVTPEKLVRSDDVHMVVVPGSEGEFGVMAGHAPFMTTLKDGELKIYKSAGSGPETITVSGGFAEVGEQGLVVLAESANA